ncbi:hypothetical protein LIER_35019 [Lithospermum erythrorhizon]|uniref:Uncharacterized protein n=1 Tax=Lithospermum erythrorhizon TaxID=34254 RepID=A0AAV3NI97_LITER
MEIEPNDSFNYESASGMKNAPIQEGIEGIEGVVSNDDESLKSTDQFGSKLEKELQGTKGMEWTVSKDKEIRKNTDQLGAILEQNVNKPCSDNQDSSMLIEHNDSFDGESASRMDNIIQIQKNGGSAGYEFSTDSSVWSESGAEILLRTGSGVPIMDSHGFLLGEWSWIDDLKFTCYVIPR